MRWLVLLTLVGCGPHDIVVADLPGDGGGQMMGGPPGKICIAATDCNDHPGDFCEFDGCGATTGRCRLRPAFCPPDFNPVCGCNGVTYWNDCLRKGAGQRAATAGQCGEPATCGSGTLCPDGQASCARLLPLGSSCSLTPQGTCWVLPPMCPQAEETGAWETCGGGPLVCGGLCSAIRSGQTRRAVNSCP